MFNDLYDTGFRLKYIIIMHVGILACTQHQKFIYHELDVICTGKHKHTYSKSLWRLPSLYISQSHIKFCQREICYVASGLCIYTTICLVTKIFLSCGYRLNRLQLYSCINTTKGILCVEGYVRSAELVVNFIKLP